MQKITPFLWFEKDSQKIIDFYTTAFGDVKAKNVVTLQDTPSGDTDVASLEIFGEAIGFITAGPVFKLNPSISFRIDCATKEEVDTLWEKFSEGGMALMGLDKYPFSEWYGWIQDQYGVSWQIMYVGQRPVKQRITPTLMFVGEQCGKAEEAIKFYTSIFHDTAIGGIMRYEKSEGPDEEGTIQYAAFTLEGQEFAAMDSALKHEFAFNEAVSFEVRCEDQEEIDYFWGRLSADPESEQCGWLKDQFGVSWQIVPVAMDAMMKSKDEEKIARVTQALLKMKKLDIAKLEEAFEGR